METASGRTGGCDSQREQYERHTRPARTPESRKPHSHNFRKTLWNNRTGGNGQHNFTDSDYHEFRYRVLDIPFEGKDCDGEDGREISLTSVVTRPPARALLSMTVEIFQRQVIIESDTAAPLGSDLRLPMVEGKTSQ